VRETLRRWFVEFGPIPRELYMRDGASLMVAKYLIDACFIRVVSGTWWTPLDYLSPGITMREEKLALIPAWALVALVVWTLPFVWVGVSYSVRRAMDAGRAPGLGLFFFVPFLSYLMMAYLSWAPSRQAGWLEAHRQVADATDRWRPALLSVGVTLALGAGFIGVSTVWLNEYGTSLFFALPAMLGVTAGWVYNHGVERSLRATFGIASLSLVILGALLLAFAWEGVICLLFALPLAFPLVLGGAIIGRMLAQLGSPRVAMAPSLLILPLGLLVDGTVMPPSVPREVLTTVEIDAPPEVVWRYVIDFPPLAPPTELPFRVGIAYPMNARLVGTGVGAVRYCEFSTGAFVEPITAWEPGQRLAFDVVDQPEPLRELSPWGAIAPKHLNSGFRSVRGEFRLIPLPGGRTRLEGRTWYRVGLEPAAYWQPITDGMIHIIHQRVLDHVAALSESAER